MNWPQLRSRFWSAFRWGGVALLIALWWRGSALHAGEPSEANSIAKPLAAIRAESPDLRWETIERREAPGELVSAVSAYVKFYGLDLPCAQHLFGYVDAGKKRIATHVFVPEDSARGTVVVAHGYYDHAATWQHAIRAILAAKLAVVIYDQPGHGLSGGPRATVGDFSEYVEVMREIVARTREHLPGPYHIAAHSMGCAVSIDYLLHDPNAAAIENVVLAAPLVRSAHWHLSNGGNRLAKPFVKSIPRAFRDNSSDKAYLEFVKRDPLHTRELPLKWADALRSWNVRAETFSASSRRVLVIQGDRDRTVDAKYNLPFLKRLFPHSRVLMIEGGGHQLLNETEAMRRKTLDSVCLFLTEGQP